MNAPYSSKQRNFVVGLIVLGLIIIGFFGLRVVRAFREFRGHRPPPPFATEHIETDISLIRDWMTIPFISKMYGVPPDLLFDSLGISPHNNREKSLKQLNEEFFPSAEGLVIEQIKLTILAHQPPPIPTTLNTPPVP